MEKITFEEHVEILNDIINSDDKEVEKYNL